MKKLLNSPVVLMVAVLFFATLACGQPEVSVGIDNSSNIHLNAENGQGEDTTEIEEPVVEYIELSQWAYDAEATSSYTDSDWSAMQATGAPDTTECGDTPSAWASLTGSGVDTLTVYFRTPVYAYQVDIYQTYTPDQVVSVELIDVDGANYEVYTNTPKDRWEDCPLVTSIVIDTTDYLVHGVSITVDESQLGLGWNEIDAVQLVGYALKEGVAQSPPEETSPDEAPSVQVPVGDITMPDGLLWFVNEDNSGINFGTFGDISVSDDGRVYVPDNGNGIFVYDMDGKQLDLIDYEDRVNPVDVKIGPDGNLYVADWGADGIFILSQDGDLISSFGERGNDTGQFGAFGPKALAVGPDNTIFALDDNRDADDNPFMRIMMFSKDGKYLGEIPVEDGQFPVGMDFGPDGYLYIVNYFGNNLLKFDGEGNFIGELGADALESSDPQYVDFDNAGLIYLTVWREPGVVVLDPAGNFLGRFGYEEEPDVTPWPDGAMNYPTGIGVSGDGARVFFSDYANQQPFLEAISLE
jgi:DNA-binding beta-propeller fold protein YncE